jgi:hypothetical protein
MDGLDRHKEGKNKQDKTWGEGVSAERLGQNVKGQPVSLRGQRVCQARRLRVPEMLTSVLIGPQF